MAQKAEITNELTHSILLARSFFSLASLKMLLASLGAGFAHMKIADGSATLLQLLGLIGRLCPIASQ